MTASHLLATDSTVLCVHACHRAGVVEGVRRGKEGSIAEAHQYQTTHAPQGEVVQLLPGLREREAWDIRTVCVLGAQSAAFLVVIYLRARWMLLDTCWATGASDI